jgi:hypothetical protein
MLGPTTVIILYSKPISFYEIWVSHDRDWDAMWYAECIWTFWRNELPPSSCSKIKPSKQKAACSIINHEYIGNAVLQNASKILEDCTVSHQRR